MRLQHGQVVTDGPPVRWGPLTFPPAVSEILHAHRLPPHSRPSPAQDAEKVSQASCDSCLSRQRRPGLSYGGRLWILSASLAPFPGEKGLPVGLSETQSERRMPSQLAESDFSRRLACLSGFYSGFFRNTHPPLRDFLPSAS